MTLSNKHLHDVCLLRSEDKSSICRYLANDDLDSSKWHCQKLKANAKKSIDREVERSLDVVPSGDNCQGYPVLKNILQGYDVD